MTVRYLENKGSGNILEITRTRLLELTPNVYPLTWEAILSGNGDSAAILGAGFAEREVFFGFEGVDLTCEELPTIDCYDVATNPPEKFLVLRSQYPNLRINYFCDRNLADLELAKLYAPKSLRLVSVHGVLDYLPRRGKGDWVWGKGKKLKTFPYGYKAVEKIDKNWTAFITTIMRG